MHRGWLVVRLAVAAAVVPATDAGAQDLEQLVRDRRFHEALRVAEAGIANDSSDAELRLVAGQAALETGRPAIALPHLERAIELVDGEGWLGGWAELHLARTLYAMGRYEESRGALERASFNGATRNLTNAVTGFEAVAGFGYAYDDWRVHVSEQLRIHHPPEIGSVDAEAIAARMEAAFDSIASFLDVRPLKRVDVFVWDSPERARAARIGRPGFSVPEIGVIHTRPDQSPGHELMHVLSFNALSPSTRTRFVNEGAATLFDATGRNRLASARIAVRERAEPVDIRALWLDQGQESESVLYAVAAAFLERLRAAGSREEFLALLRDQTLDGAQRVYGARLDGTIAAFEAALGAD